MTENLLPRKFAEIKERRDALSPILEFVVFGESRETNGNVGFDGRHSMWQCAVPGLCCVQQLLFRKSLRLPSNAGATIKRTRDCQLTFERLGTRLSNSIINRSPRPLADCQVPERMTFDEAGKLIKKGDMIRLRKELPDRLNPSLCNWYSWTVPNLFGDSKRTANCVFQSFMACSEGSFLRSLGLRACPLRGRRP